MLSCFPLNKCARAWVCMNVVNVSAQAAEFLFSLKYLSNILRSFISHVHARTHDTHVHYTTPGVITEARERMNARLTALEGDISTSLTAAFALLGRLVEVWWRMRAKREVWSREREERQIPRRPMWLC